MGPLSGYRVLEVAGLGPGPFAAMLLAARTGAGPDEQIPSVRCSIKWKAA